MAYTTATIVSSVQEADGRIHLSILYGGNAGEVPITEEFLVNTSTTLGTNYLRSHAMDRIAALNANLTAKTGITTPQVLDVTTPLPAATPSTFGAFVAASAPFTPGATPQDVFTITGSASKLVTVTGVSLTTVQTTSGINAWSLVKRSTANSAGTSTVVTAVPTQSGFPAATATVRQYTANPTLGTLIGSVWAGRVLSPAIAAVTSGPLETPCTCVTPITLLNATQVLALNFGGAALPAGLSVQAIVWWNES